MNEVQVIVYLRSIFVSRLQNTLSLYQSLWGRELSNNFLLNFELIHVQILLISQSVPQEIQL